MKNIQINLSYIFLTLFFIIFSGCANKIAFPISRESEYIKMLEPIEGYYESKIGKKNIINIAPHEYKSKYTLLRWPENNYKTICLRNKICLLDTLNNGYFSHAAVIGRKELYPLTKPSKYIKLKEPSIYHNEKEETGIKIIYLPKLNTISTKEVGESMYQKINQFIFDTYTTTVNFEIDDVIFNGKYDLLEWNEAKYKTICNKYEICLLDLNNNGIFSHYSFDYEPNFIPLAEPYTYKLVQNTSFNEDSFKYEVLYQGKVNNSIKISFREFKNDMARPAFTQDIEYQLEANKPTVIGFKGLRIKVIKATNLDITYSVVKDFN